MAKTELQERDGKFFIKGELSFQSVPSLVDKLNFSEAELVINLSEVSYSDSSGLALLVNWLREAKKCSVKICFEAIPQKMMALAKVSNLDKILPIVSH